MDNPAPGQQQVFKTVWLILKTSFSSGNFVVKSVAINNKKQITGQFVEIFGGKRTIFNYIIDPALGKISYSPQVEKKDSHFLMNYWQGRLQARRGRDFKPSLAEVGRSQTREDISYQTKANKAGKVLNCKPGKSYPCGAKCNSLHSPCKGQPMPHGYIPVAKQVVSAVTKQQSVATTPLSVPVTTAVLPPISTTKPPRQPKSAKTNTTTPTKVSTSIQSATSTQPLTQPTRNPAIHTNDAALQKYRKELINRVGQKTVEDAESNTHKILNDPNTNLFVRVSQAKTLELILGNRFKNAVELGVTSHTIPHLKDDYLTARKRVELETNGYPLNYKAEDRPISAYFGSSDLSGASHQDVSAAYGSIAVKLKPTVKERATFTGADSFKSGIASDLNAKGTPPPPNAASIASVTRHGYGIDKLPTHYPSHYSDDSIHKGQLQSAAKAKDINDLAKAGAPTGNAYVEAQVHGQLHPSDIAELHFSPKNSNDEPTAAIASWAKINGVKIYTHGVEQDLDALINPPAKNKAQIISDAIERGDFDTLHKTAAAISQASKNYNKSAADPPDQILGTLFDETGYSNKPKVGTADDVTKVRDSGGLLMVRGCNPVKGDRTKGLTDFQSGDYFVGNGVYGNGTYVAHAGHYQGDKFIAHDATRSKKDAVDAIGCLRATGYSSASGVTMRMALPKDAKIIANKDLIKEAKAVAAKIDKLFQTEKNKIMASQSGSGAADVQKYNAEEAKLKKEYANNYSTKPILAVTTKTTGTASSSLGRKPVQVTLNEYSISLPGKGKNKNNTLNLDGYKLKEIPRMFGGKNPHYEIHAPDGTKIANTFGTTFINKKDAISEALNHYIEQKALKNTGLKVKPTPGSSIDSTTQAKLKTLKDTFETTKNVLFGDTKDEMTGKYHYCSGRFATIRGYDAIALKDGWGKGKSGESRFMNLLNRSKVTIQKDELNYKTALKDVAG